MQRNEGLINVITDFSLSSASFFSLLGGSLSFVVLTSIEFSGLQCINVWGATGNTLVLLVWTNFWVGDFRMGTFWGQDQDQPFYCFFFFYLRIAELQLLLEAFVEQNIWFIHRLCFCGHTGIIFSSEAVREKSCYSDWQNKTSLVSWVVKRILFVCVLVLGKGGCILVSS